MKRHVYTRIIVAAVFGAAVGAAAHSASPAADMQMAEGKAHYAAKCARCHGQTMDGVEHAPALRGDEFRAEWTGRAARELYKRIISTMPQDDPGSIPEQDVIRITAYVLSANDFVLPAVQKANDLNTIKLDLDP